MAKFEIPDGWCVQAFRFTLDPTEEQSRALARHFGARRKAYNWTVATLKADIEAWRATGIETEKPSLRVLRKRWNQVKGEVCVNAVTGLPWWAQCSKEAFLPQHPRGVQALNNDPAVSLGQSCCQAMQMVGTDIVDPAMQPGHLGSALTILP